MRILFIKAGGKIIYIDLYQDHLFYPVHTVSLFFIKRGNNVMKKLYKNFLIVIFSSLFILPIASAEPYIGLNLGKANLSSSYDEATSAFIYAGIDMGNIAVEAGITPLGYYSFKAFDASVQYDGFEIDVLAKLYDNGGFTPYAKLGYYSYTRKAKVFGISAPDESGNTITYGVGIMTDLGQTLQARIAYEIYDDVDNQQVTRLIFGLAAKIF